MITRSASRFSLRTLHGVSTRPATSRIASACTKVSFTSSVRYNSLLSTPETIEKVARNAVKNAVRGKSDNITSESQDVEKSLSEAILKETETIKWIQELLDTTEGGGYIVPEAGLLSHNIFWGDMDTFQHVNNVTYLKWFETARVNLFEIYGKSNKAFDGFMGGKVVGPIIRSVELSWRYPITFPDTITVVHKIEPTIDADRFYLKGVVVSHNARKVAARIRETIVTVDYSKGGIKAPIPDQIRQAFEERLKLQDRLAPNKKN